MSDVYVNLKDIRLDGGTQFRLELNNDKVKEYVEAIIDGAEFPPVKVVNDGQCYWLTDGFHRVAAYAQANYERIRAEVTDGSRRDAVIAALSANATNGLPRSNDDKRKAVIFALRDPELRQMSQREIARVCGVTQAMVSKVAAEIMPSKKKAGDNSYQFDTPYAVVNAMKDEEKGRLISCAMFNGWLEPKFVKRFQQLGLMTEYALSGKREMTPLAQETLKVLASGDRWMAFEIDLIQRNRQADKSERVYISAAGHAKAVLEHLLKCNGWDDLRGATYVWDSWANLLAWGGYVQREKVQVSEYQGSVYYHITKAGCKLLELPYSVPMKPPPTVEDYLEQKRQRDEEWRKQQQKVAEERKKGIDPAKEAKKERDDVLYWLKRAQHYALGATYMDIDKDQVTAMFEALATLVEATGVVAHGE